VSLVRAKKKLFVVLNEITIITSNRTRWSIPFPSLISGESGTRFESVTFLIVVDIHVDQCFLFAGFVTLSQDLLLRFTQFASYLYSIAGKVLRFTHNALLGIHHKGRKNWSTNTYIERIFECFDIGEEFIQRVLLR
jgi:hypothetical protein